MKSEQKKSLLCLDEHEDLQDFAVSVGGKVYYFAKSWNTEGIYVVDYRKGRPCDNENVRTIHQTFQDFSP
jgi:hypothetical protein